MKKLRRLFCFLAGAVAGVCLFAGYAVGSVVLHLTNEDLAKAADRIMRGTVVSVESRYNHDMTMLHTFTAIQVTEFLKGAGKESEIVIRQIGGEIGELKMLTEGDAKFEKAEEVIVFVRKFEDESDHFVVGMKQGKFTVKKNPDGVMVVSRDFQGLSLAKMGGDGVPVVYEARPEPKEVPLEDFLKEIRGLLKTKGSRKNKFPF